MGHLLFNIETGDFEPWHSGDFHGEERMGKAKSQWPALEAHFVATETVMQAVLAAIAQTQPATGEVIARLLQEAGAHAGTDSAVRERLARYSAALAQSLARRLQ